MKSLENFSSFEITNAAEVEGGLLSLFCAPKKSYQPATPVTPVTPPAQCYTPPAPSCNTGGYTNPCAPKATKHKSGLSLSLGLSLGLGLC